MLSVGFAANNVVLLSDGERARSLPVHKLFVVLFSVESRLFSKCDEFTSSTVGRKKSRLPVIDNVCTEGNL